MVVPRKTKEAEITEQDSLVLGAGNKMHPVHPADKCKGPIQPVGKGASDEKHPVRTIDKGKGPAWPVNIGANGNQAEHVLPDLQMHPFGGNMDKVCIVPGRLYQKLQPHQQEGLHWLWRIYCQHSGGIVADDMGMGKTLQTVAFLSGLLHSDIIRRAMIIVPVSVLASWSEELTNAGLAKHFHIYHGSGERGLQIVNERGGILVTTYETYGSKFKELTAVDWDYTILDEAHRIKNLMSNVRKQVDNIECRKKLLLTGTPLPRNLLDIFSLMKFIKPDVLGDQHTFHKKYMRPAELGQYLNSTERNKKRFIKALASGRKEISPYILRRTKSVLIESGELPCKNTELIVWLRLTELQVFSMFSGTAVLST
ncbi:protein CHROMATIN REMODELING 24-like [Setaria italica]|uniref:protein CHROMATIN REMODELING 24-like n=1 Tax=Setaria italica TaxID=4555 RepID=UPI000BE621C4|nr:protein CHROMATIN REMODELING 24-like [Setaria italica]